jgi:hypothetical protein
MSKFKKFSKLLEYFWMSSIPRMTNIRVLVMGIAEDCCPKACFYELSRGAMFFFSNGVFHKIIIENPFVYRISLIKVHAKIHIDQVNLISFLTISRTH